MMAAGIGSKIEYLDYNEIQSIVRDVFGTGAGDYGYGQTVTSSQVSQHAIVTVSQWNSLRNDLLKSRQHQSGVDESGNLGLPTLDIRLADADRAAYLSMANLVKNNRSITPPSGEASFVTLTTATRASGWNSSISHTITIEFGTQDKLRWFFNSGGNFQLSASLTNYQTSGDSALVNSSWYTLLTNMGIIKLSRSTTTNTGTGNPAIGIGFGNLTSTDQLIFNKLVEAGNQYTPNQYDLYARIYGGSALIFTPTWSYTDAGNDGSYRVFEPVIGTLTSTCQMYIASGANVAVPYPTAEVSGSGWSYTSAYVTPPPTYSVSPSATLVNEGNTVTYSVNTSGVANGTVLYWTNSGTTSAQDFTSNTNSGSFTVSADLGSIVRQLSSDLTTEGSETIILQIRTGSISGPVVATSSMVTITDISVTPVSVTIVPSTLSIDEGQTITFAINTVGIANGTVLYWTNTGTTVLEDFADTTNSGSFIVNLNLGIVTRPLSADLTTEGPESIVLNVHSGSIAGPIISTSSTIVVADVSRS
jgi:predicted RecA/RadA family phage recombinase